MPVAIGPRTVPTNLAMRHLSLYFSGMGIGQRMARVGLDALTKLSPRVAMEGVSEWNRLVLRGDIERARSRIRLEFLKNRALAKVIYSKHSNDMSPEVRAIFEELIGELEI